MGIIAGMDASSGAPVPVDDIARRLVRDAARTLSARARAGVVRPDRRRHLRLPGDPDRPAGVPVPRAKPRRRALDRRLGAARGSPRRSRTGCRSRRTRSTSSCCRTRSSSRAIRTSCCARSTARCAPKDRSSSPGSIRSACSAPSAISGAAQIAAVERQLHRAVPAQGLARAARLRGDGRRPRLLRAAVREREMARAVRLFRGRRRPLVADRRRRLLPARDEEGARHAHHHARVGAPQERPRDGAAAGAPVHRAHDERSGSVASQGTTASFDLHRRRMQGQSRARAAGARCSSSATREKELFGGEPATTNNRMELTAVIARSKR